MFNFNLDKMLFCISSNEHDSDSIRKTLMAHPEVKFVSLTGVDLGGHSTDEKIPMRAFLNDMEDILWDGVQTDGSSVALPKIAELSNARVDILPDKEVNWYVEYNFDNVDSKTGLPTGTLRIPSFLRHNNDKMVCSRIFNRRTTKRFRRGLKKLLELHPYTFRYMAGIDNADEIDDVILTAATELEFWVKTPDDSADRDQLFTSQELKEQYWKRTIGPVRTAFEQTIELLDRYGFEVEMGHKEVGGVRAKMGNSGIYDHIMEQLEIDWKYASPMQAADNEIQVKHIVRDVFRYNNLDVTFLAKPIDGVAGSGEHTHLGVAFRLKNGKTVNAFSPLDTDNHYMNPIGFGALMGILKNYEIYNPFIAATHDAFRRLKPGFEAPVCIVTSLGKDSLTPSRNRTVLIGLVRDEGNPMAMRFELRSPNPHSNTYLVIGAGYSFMLDGINAVLESEKNPDELAISISKKQGEKDFYLEADREYRSEENVFDYYTKKERESLFGKAPATVWESFKALENLSDEKINMITGGEENLNLIIESYKAQMINKWKTEYHDRIIPNAMNFVRYCKKKHDEKEASDYDILNWSMIAALRNELGRDYIERKSILTEAKTALDNEDYEKASDLEILIQEKTGELRYMYGEYKKNLF